MEKGSSTIWDSVKKENVLFLLIDFQKSFFPLLKSKILKEVRRNILLALRMFKKMGVPMIGTEHYVQGLGHTDLEVVDEWKGKGFTDKVTFSCCGDAAFLDNLKEYERPVVVVAGLETHICVLQTVIDLRRKNFQVIVLTDGVISSTKPKWQNGLALMEKEGAHPVNTETLLFYLLGRADTPEFKYLVSLLKENQK